MLMFDVIVKNGKVVDGTGNPWFKADVGIKGGRIVKVGHLSSVEAEGIIDAKGLAVCPGFIDAHTHSDMTIPFGPKVESAVRQGVTTMVTGNCGMSLAPVNPAKENLLMRYIAPLMPPGRKMKVEWRTFGEYLDKMEEKGIAVNVAPLVGHGTAKIAVMGFEDRPPTAEELEEMKALIHEAMLSGAVGMSTGLIYAPGAYSKTDEIIELAKVVAKHGGVYASHIRNEGATLMEAMEEAIEIGEKAQVPVHISHHKASGRAFWGKTEKSLRLMEEARARGVDITCDQYPYEAGMTSLVMLLPLWAHEGGMDKLLERLRNPEDREKMRKDLEDMVYGWEDIYVGYVETEKNKPLEGKNLVEIAKARGTDEFTALCNLLLEENGIASMVVFSMGEEDIRRVMRHHLQMVGSDSWAVAPYDILGAGKPHPRFYGTFPRILGKYVREEKVLTLEEAVRKMTSFPAQRFGLRDRGLVREGFWADLVVFDPETIRDRATYQDPHQYPEGIEYVMVNGKIVVEKGEHTGVLAGKVLRHGVP
ncbi:MAG: D-aminoacylase [Candidatus Bathyarchaeia archaeon]